MLKVMLKTRPKFSAARVFENILNNFLETRVGADLFFNFGQRIHNGGMVAAAEFLADFLHRHAGDLVNDIHSGHPGGGDVAAALAAADIGRGDVEDVYKRQ